MPPADIFDRIEHDVLPVLPGRAHDLARLRALHAQAGLSTVTVIGKYNHGKSRLLNELMGEDTFAVADKRETTGLNVHVKDSVRWLDAPGLDADVGQDDDRFARQAAWLQSDIRLFVHSAKEGELDAQERSLLQALRADADSTRRQTLLVVSQVDQVADGAQLQQVLGAIGRQAQGMALNAASSTRHRQGVDGGKKLLIERSGIPALRAALDQALRQVPQARAHESAQLKSAMHQELLQREAALGKQNDELLGLQAQQRRQFDQDLGAVFDKARQDLAEVMATPGPDLALRPDTAHDKFRLTAGRMERARVQVAYSKVCIQLNAALTRHGAIELPTAQHTVARSLNSVMVAVLGVSVKYREDLRRMFYDDAGREDLQRDFARYYEISADRQALAARIAQVDGQRAAVRTALQSLRALQALEDAA
ncbi:GTPase [Acidovorax sp. CCYZU-2555]|uniref:GTPase n=1 Tax=Acidovorax sp. CCYZU-2555 TaxID=2835042 RepID=UPI001BCBDE58|nr:GTPase [Acidovorax sp. CCYZU-2555]MBS7780947.1 50S ribosome-binding GTPase [Acidovorax sp. CCYZU-2555]